MRGCSEELVIALVIGTDRKAGGPKTARRGAARWRPGSTII